MAYTIHIIDAGLGQIGPMVASGYDRAHVISALESAGIIEYNTRQTWSLPRFGRELVISNPRCSARPSCIVRHV